MNRLHKASKGALTVGRQTTVSRTPGPDGSPAFSLVEILIAAAIAAVLGLPLLGIISSSDKHAVVSEDYMFAEALAQRYLAELLAVPLEEFVPVEKAIPVYGHDKDEELRMKEFESYVKNRSGDSFKGTVSADQVRPGLYRYCVKIEWPLAPGSERKRKYVLLRYRCRNTLSATTSFAQPGAQNLRNRLLVYE